MITKLRERSQITLPAEIIKKMRLAPGDTLKGLLTPLDIPYGMVEDEISMRGIKLEKNISN